MSVPPELLLITWNRREYVEKTLANLLASRSEFRLYCWDNASHDGTADVIASLDDPRVVRKHFSKANVMQREPSLWFLEEGRGDLVGKIDDDILLPDGWVDTLAPLLRAEPRFGMLACWIFMQEDWDERLAAHKVVEVNGVRVFRNTWVAGQSFLARRAVLRDYVRPPGRYGFPIDQMRMTDDGFINGFPLPLLFAHNMDDPRSPHCMMNRTSGLGEQAALTARNGGFSSAEEYGKWIAADARAILRDPVSRQLHRHRLLVDPSIKAKFLRRFYRAWDAVRA